MKRAMLLFLLFSIITLTSCSKSQISGSSDKEKKFQAIVPFSDVNKSLQLEVYGDDKKFQPGSQIHLRLYNKSPYSIQFETNSHMKLLLFINQKWIELENGDTYSGKLILSSQATPLLNSNTTWVQPIVDLTSLEKSKEDFVVRIVIIGEFVENQTPNGMPVGAYIDVDFSQ